MKTTVRVRGHKIQLLDISTPKLCKIINAARKMQGMTHGMPRPIRNTLCALIEQREVRMNDQGIIVPTFNEWLG